MRISRALLGGELDPAMLESAERSTFVEVADPVRQYSSFWLRLLAATVIATAGVASDSSTTVIGAMLVAPLMSPMLGTALAVAVGRPADAARTLLQTVLGMAFVVVVSAAVTNLIPIDGGMSLNGQVTSRIAPRLVDMAIALSAGFVAALASLRSDIPDALPGVAISASIVPPLCVVGAGICEGAYTASLGAFTLFITNYIAIQVSGAVVYLLAGLGSRRLPARDGRSRALWYALVSAVMVVLVVLLGGASLSVARAAERDRAARDVAASWTESTGYRVSQLSIVGDDLYVEVSGEGAVPSAESLRDDLDGAGIAFGRISVAARPEQTVKG